jgi:regulator of RNase E activity RraA
VNPGPGSVAEPSGITDLIDGLVRQNLRRDPTRRLLPGDVVTIEAVDADVAVSIRPSPGGIAVVDGRDPGARVVVSAASTTLLELAGAPLRFGLPDALTHDGRALIGDLLTKRIRVRGLIRHLGTVRRLTMLLSAR